MIAVGWAGFLPMRFTSRYIISMGKQVAHPTALLPNLRLLRFARNDINLKSI